jgi:hypothetical protein
MFFGFEIFDLSARRVGARGIARGFGSANS